MAVDFEPHTRRQLHFHEALTQSQSGTFGAEALAHLMVTSQLANEPPDPTTQAQANAEQTQGLEKALVATAETLVQQQQYRSASRILKTALLYSPNSKEAREALAKVHSEWAQWLADSGEFAHAVGLVREALRRQPDSSEIAAQLEAIYQRWMTWSQEQGDPAARDLLAVYLQQEQASLEQFRAAWQESLAAATQAAAAPPAAVPAVSAQMPATPPPVQSSPPSPSAAEVAPPAAEAPAAAEAPPAAAEPVTPSAVEAPTPAEPAQAATPAVAAEVKTEPLPQTQAAAPDSAAAPAAPEPVEDEVAAATEPPPAEAQKTGSKFSGIDEALSQLDAAPTDEEVCEAVFEYFKPNMRTLTTALRDRATSHSDQPHWLLLLARAFRRSGSETMAVIQYQKYIKAAPTPEAYEELAQTYEEIGKEDFAKMTRRKAERAFAD